MTLDERDVDPWASEEDDELVRRLRKLEWPKPSPEVRARCLEGVWRRLAQDDGNVVGSGEPPAGDRDLFRPHEFSRRRPAMSAQGALGERLSAARGLSAPVGGHRPYTVHRAYAVR